MLLSKFVMCSPQLLSVSVLIERSSELEENVTGLLQEDCRSFSFGTRSDDQDSFSPPRSSWRLVQKGYSCSSRPALPARLWWPFKRRTFQLAQQVWHMDNGWLGAMVWGRERRWWPSCSKPADILWARERNVSTKQYCTVHTLDRAFSLLILFCFLQWWGRGST